MAEIHIYPRDAVTRAERREEILGIAIDAARSRAAKVGHSAKCAGEGMAVQHASTPGGCANNGTSCLCECHDLGAASGGTS